MKILWVEDFGGCFHPSPYLLREIFGEIISRNIFDKFNEEFDHLDGYFAQELSRFSKSLIPHHEILLCQSYVEWKERYVASRGPADIAILDINLNRFRTPDNGRPKGADDSFDSSAGIYIYQQLRKGGIPDDRIAILTGEAGSLGDFIRHCKSIFIEPPRHCFEKDSRDIAKLRAWLAIRFEAVVKECNRIFVSYAREDVCSICGLVKLLEDNGFHTWFDQRDLAPGADWDFEIQRAIKSCKFFLACFSSKSISKEGYFQKELKRGLECLERMPENTIFLIPVRLDMCQVPRRFDHLHWCDLFEVDGTDKLLEALRAGLEKRST